MQSTIVASQLPVEHWHEIMEVPTLSDALLDRLVHNAHRIHLQGETKSKHRLPLCANLSMSSVFISYSHHDDETVNELHVELEGHGAAIWRDQQSLYGGTYWPKALGEAIRANDFFLLCWSKQAKASHFVELEWNIALALKKTIIPFLLDTTPLPPALNPIHGVRSVEAVLQALAKPVSNGKTNEQEEVIRRLEAVTETDPAKIVEVVRATFYQPGMQVGGNVVNVAGNYIAEKTDASKGKKPLEKWHAWGALVMVLLTALTLLIDLPEKIQGLFVSDEPKLTTHTFTEIIRDRETGSLLPGVVVHILDVAEVEGDTLTNHLGRFAFTFETLKPHVEIEGYREGYQPLRMNVMLTPPNTHNTFPMVPFSP